MKETVKTFLDFSDPGELAKVLSDTEWQRLWKALTGQDGGGRDQHWIPESLSKILSLQTISIPQTNLIPAKRQLGAKGSVFDDLSEKGLIDRLAEIQSPDHHERDNRLLFNKINTFLQDVTGKTEAVIEVPHDRKHLLVHMDDKVLPLQSLGTGIHEVILIAAACTLRGDQIVCIEEPEIHLHPVLQRKLIMYLQKHTTNQYFIATHSAAFIDTPGASVFRVTNEGDQTRVYSAKLRSEKRNICADLGYKASDLMQANAVVWVEGPSDRIYLKHWIAAAKPALVEGIHFSIMFYGGRLLSHLNADADEINDFISLRSLNQNLAVVIDSDMDSARGHIIATKKRIVSELNEGKSITWVTKGREIENYIDHNRLQEAVRSIHSEAYGEPAEGGPYVHSLHFIKGGKKSGRGKAIFEPEIFTKIDKVRVAKTVCEHPADLTILDLREKIGNIVEMISAAND